MKSVVLTDLKPKILLYKIGFGLKTKGIKTILFSIFKTDKDFCSGSFDDVICLELDNLKPMTLFKSLLKDPLKFVKFFYRLFTIKADALIAECPPYYLGAFFTRIFRKKCTTLYLPYDMYSTRIKRTSKSFSKVQSFWEKHNILNCDGLIHKGPREELEIFPKSWTKGKSTLKFETYPLKKFFVPYDKKKKLSYKDKQIHIVHVGSFQKGNFLYSSMIPDVNKVLKQGFHLHIYLNSTSFNQKDIDEATDKIPALRKLLHIHEYIHPGKLSEEINKYDWGIFFSVLTKDGLPSARKFAASNQTATFLEANLPAIMTHNKAEFIGKPLQNNYLGLVVNDISTLRKRIEEFDYEKSIKNIKRYREENCIENKIDELIKFIDCLRLKKVKI